MTELNDDVIISQATKGDSEAFGLLYERYVSRIYCYIYYRTGSSSDAEDLTARVFLRAMKNICRYVDKGLPFSAWLYRIAHNLVANWHRDSSRRKEISLDDVIIQSTTSHYPEQELVALEDKDKLLKVIRRLPQDRQQLLILKFSDNLSNAEIGLIMGKSEGAIKSLYHRTLLSLRDDIEKFGDFSHE